MAPRARTRLGARVMEGWVNEVLLTLREVFDYVEGLAEDYGGKRVLYEELELMVVSVPSSMLEDYLDVVASLADEVVACGEGVRRTLYLVFSLDDSVKLVVKARPFYAFRGRIYVGFRAVGIDCPRCGKRVRLGCKPSGSDTDA